MIHDLGSIERRLIRLEHKAGGDVLFAMPDGAVEGMRGVHIQQALDDAIHHRPSRYARLMLGALRVTGAGCIHELARALADGPVENERESEHAV